VVGYVNTTADVKAECDACCTSSNAVRVVEALPSEHILFVPDRNLAAYVQSQTRKTIIAWDGACYVHQQITPEQVAAVRRALPHVRILVHPECRSDVLALADAVLSTSGMVRYAKESPAEEFLIVTECGLSDRLLLEVPGKRFYKSCKLCQYMKLITLEATRDALRDLAPEVTVPEPIRLRAERALTRMLELGGCPAPLARPGGRGYTPRHAWPAPLPVGRSSRSALPRRASGSSWCSTRSERGPCRASRWRRSWSRRRSRRRRRWPPPRRSPWRSARRSCSSSSSPSSRCSPPKRRRATDSSGPGLRSSGLRSATRRFTRGFFPARRSWRGHSSGPTARACRWRSPRAATGRSTCSSRGGSPRRPTGPPCPWHTRSRSKMPSTTSRRCAAASRKP